MPDITFNGPEGRIEGRYHHSKIVNARLALVLHPHPQHGGSMHTNIVYNVFHTFVRRGFSALRFNFRGVGRSEGRYDAGVGELADAAAALDWMQAHNANAESCWIAGYSFGAWISMQLLMRRPEIAGFISIAPPANMYDFTFLNPCPSSGLFVHGDKDVHVPEEDVAKLAERLSAQKAIEIRYDIVAGADHSFGSRIEKLQERINDYLDFRLSTEAA